MWSSLDVGLGVLFMFLAAGVIVLSAMAIAVAYAWVAGRLFAGMPVYLDEL